MSQYTIKPFQISIADAKIKLLHQKLALTDFANELETDSQSPWTRGPPLSEIKRLTEYWRTKYDWRKAEASLNERLPQFMTSIEVEGFGRYDVHFVHKRSPVKNAIPLLFLHGWPGNFIEVSKIIDPLTSGDGVDQPAFHIVAPSLIDYGFSSGSRAADFHLDQHAEVYHKLMQLLGYHKYVAQGGDLGYLLCRILAQLYPNHCVAHHINMSVPAKPNATKHPELFQKWQDQGAYGGLSASEAEELDRARNFEKEGKGYFILQSTRPMALAYGMTDSPVGLLAWIYDKLVLWSDSYAWTPDEILTWVSIFYFSTAGPAASFNIYYANEHRKPLKGFDQAKEWTGIPLGISRFPHDISNLPRVWNLSLGPIVFEAAHDRGGHFAAYEVPEILIQDLRTMFGRGGGAFGVVDGANGFVQPLGERKQSGSRL